MAMSGDFGLRDQPPSGLDPGRVSQLVVDVGAKERRGSGYRVTNELVMTAGHVLDDAVTVTAHFLDVNTGARWKANASNWWALPECDIGLVRIERDAQSFVTPARYGRIGESHAAGVVVQAIGFPRWKLRNEEVDPTLGMVYREAAFVRGSVPPYANFWERSLEIELHSPPPARERYSDHSPWEGISGACVWVGDRIVGVVNKHYPREGLSRLTATRLDKALDQFNGLVAPQD